MLAKFVVFFSIATVIIVEAQPVNVPDDFIVVDEVPERCEVGRKYKVDCNTCTCLAEDSLACTRMKCVHPPQNPQKRSAEELSDEQWGPLWTPGTPCVPENQFYSECNRCKCTRDGKHAICTLKACNRPAVSM